MWITSDMIVGRRKKISTSTVVVGVVLVGVVLVCIVGLLFLV